MSRGVVVSVGLDLSNILLAHDCGIIVQDRDDDNVWLQILYKSW
jgi:hypothetical protein